MADSGARGMDIDDTATWVPYRKGMCDTCYAGCCTLIVEVTGEDLVRIKATDEWELENDLKGLVRRLEREGMIQRYNARTGKFILSQRSGGECVFLTDERR